MEIPEMDASLQSRLQNLFSGATRVTVLTGAGISAESGIPTFRGPEGLWNNHKPEDLATPDAFARDPELVWRWYDWRRGLVAKARPNPGHAGLAGFGPRAAVRGVTPTL